MNIHSKQTLGIFILVEQLTVFSQFNLSKASELNYEIYI